VVRGILIATVAVAVLAGCGGSHRTATTSPPAAARPDQLRAVVRTWARRLNAGDNAGVAQLFRLPAVVEQGPTTYRFTSRKQLEEWHASLPCSGQVLSITVRGRFALAVFLLGNRPTSPCDGPGERAAAVFEIVRGKIVRWKQVPVPLPPPRGEHV
jgi:hypothetical protein